MVREAVIVGSGGHCTAILSLLGANRQHTISTVLDLSEPEPGELIMGVPVAPIEPLLFEFIAKDNLDFFLAIGGNLVRKFWWEKLQTFRVSCPNLISPNALVDDSANLGEGNVVCANAYIGPRATLGFNNIINTGAIIEHEATVGSHSHIAPGSIIAGRSNVSDQCFIGAGSTVIDKVSVAHGATLGAGSVLIKNASSKGGIYVGVPAKLKGGGA